MTTWWKKVLLLAACPVLSAALLAACNPTEEAVAPAVMQEVKEVTPPDQRDPNRLWCNEHGLYEDECLICHPELANKSKNANATEEKAVSERDPNRLWCNEHGLYEDECLICHPELANKMEKPEARDPNRLWCAEHSIYEDECVLCHPELKGKVSSAGHAATEDSGLSQNVLMCLEHRLPEIECGICRPDHLAQLVVGDGLKIRFASANSIGKAGVKTATPASPSASAPVELLGEVAFNRNNLASLSPRGGGIVQEIFKEVGDIVQKGEVLATVQSPDVTEAMNAYRKAQAESQLARQTLSREQELFQKKISARQDLEQAQAAVAVHESAISASRQYLRDLGIATEDLSTDVGAMSSLAVRSPLAGTVIERNAVAGTSVAAGATLFQVADLTSMWMELSIPENALATTHVGATLQTRFDAYPGLTFEGTIAWIAPSLDPPTRMLQARVLLPNPQGLLKAGLFGRANLVGTVSQTDIVVPAEAVQDIDGRPVIFTKLEDDLYESRLVQLGAKQNGHVAILAGLRPEDRVVTDGSYIVKSELLKARMGAGCTDH